MQSYFTKETRFYGKTTPEELIKKYGSPLYVYNENILRDSCRDMMNLLSLPNFYASYSIKANSNMELLKIVHDEGLRADAMSPGEIYILLEAGFKPEEIFYIPNNVSEEEMRFAVEKGVLVSVDSISQLILFGKINPGGKVAVRFNPGTGTGHHEKVVTAGEKTKFGVNIDLIQDVKNILWEYDLKLIGINQHIGSLFMEGEPYIDGIKSLLKIAEQFRGLEFIDFGGGFGVPYRKQEGQKRLDLQKLGSKLEELLEDWAKSYDGDIKFKTEPGRYISAESGVLLGTVYTKKQNYGVKYIGTDLGLNVLARPVMYDSYHEVEVYRNGNPIVSEDYEKVNIVGNICESGDIIAKERNLPVLEENDLIGIMDAGAYGFSMSSNYNNRLRPAEVLITKDGNDVLIRRRDTLEDLLRNYNF